ncbi:MAG: DUF4369 domain-containing protein [Bacteroidota bacterium]
MKKLVVIALAIVAVSCNGIIGDGFKISGEIAGLADGTKVFLEKQDEKTGMPIAVDTVKVEKGAFTFEGEAKEPQIHSVRFENTQGGFILIVEKGNIEAKINKDSIGLAKVTGTYNNDELIKFNGSMMTIQKRMMAFQKENMPKMQEAQQKNDTVVMNKLNKDFSKFQEEFKNSSVKYIEESPKSFLSILLIQGMFNEQAPDLAKIKKYYDALANDVKETTPGKKVKKQIEDLEKASKTAKK